MLYIQPRQEKLTKVIEKARLIDQCLSEVGYPDAYVGIDGSHVMVLRLFNPRHVIPRDVVTKAFELAGIKRH